MIVPVNQISKMFAHALLAAAACFMEPSGLAQSADWQSVIWREPQVRYLLADMTLGGNTKLYRDYATKERDPDSREAIRLWDTGARVVNTNEFERHWVTNQFGKDGRVMRVVFRGSNRTITGNEVLLSSDLGGHLGATRNFVGLWSLGQPLPTKQPEIDEPIHREAMRRWNAGARLVNTNWFEIRDFSGLALIVYRGTKNPAEPAHLRLNSDVAHPEVNVRYFLADMYLGGARDFYHRTAEAAHEMGCLEAVARYDAGVKITNLDQFERKQVDGNTLITRKGSNERISGTEVKLSTD